MRTILTVMNRLTIPVRTLLAAALLLVFGAAQATEVYRWTDADGVVHFSQTPPPQGADASRLTLRDPEPPAPGAETDIYDVAGQQERMQALRDERERKRQERLERQRQAERQAETHFRDAEEYRYPGWYLRPNRPVQPLPPVQRPPAGPGDPIRPPGVIRPPSPITPRGG